MSEPNRFLGRSVLVGASIAAGAVVMLSPAFGPLRAEVARSLKTVWGSWVGRPGSSPAGDERGNGVEREAVDRMVSEGGQA